MCICSKIKNAKAQFDIKKIKHFFFRFGCFKIIRKKEQKSKVKILPLFKMRGEAVLKRGIDISVYKKRLYLKNIYQNTINLRRLMWSCPERG